MARDKAPDGPSEADKPLGRDDRVSFHPMDPADVLRKLLRTPPAQRRGNHEPPDDPEPADD
ncbi:MAG: hypothetical protein ACJ74U_15145 [Jatrophihabitantaceae bacterium]